MLKDNSFQVNTFSEALFLYTKLIIKGPPRWHEGMGEKLNMERRKKYNDDVTELADIIDSAVSKAVDEADGELKL